MLCKYKNLFGEPGKGIHSIRLSNFAIVDIILTFLVAFLISKNLKYSFPIVLFIVIVLGIIAHRIFCVKTQLDLYLFY